MSIQPNASTQNMDVMSAHPSPFLVCGFNVVSGYSEDLLREATLQLRQLKVPCPRHKIEDSLYMVALAEDDEFGGIIDTKEEWGPRDRFIEQVSKVTSESIAVIRRKYAIAVVHVEKDMIKLGDFLTEAKAKTSPKGKGGRPSIYRKIDKAASDMPREISYLDLNTICNNLVKHPDFDANAQAYLIEQITANTHMGKIAAGKSVKESVKNMKAANRTVNIRNKDMPPEIDLDVMGHRSASEHAYEIMSNQGDAPDVFHNGGRMTEVLEDETGNLRISEVGPPRFKARLEERIDFVKEDKNVQAPQAVANLVFHKPLTAYPPLFRITTFPTYTAEMARVMAPGYHAESGLYHKPKPGVNIPTIPQEPTDEDVKNARDTLVDLFADFPLDSMSRDELVAAVQKGDDVPSFCHTLSVSLTPTCRDMINGPTPNHLARKDRPRTGATKLMGNASFIGTLNNAVPQSLPDSRSEVQKTIIATLDGGGNYVFFDNLPAGQENESDELAAAITAWPSYAGRRLGFTAMVTVMVKQTWLTTGNRTQLSPQLAERTLLIDLDPKMENPGERPTSSFKYNLDKHVPANAGRYIHALLVLVQNWIAKGCPKWKGQALGGFESHAEVIGGILDSAGIYGFMKNRDKLKSVVQSENPETEFLDALVEEHHATPKGYDGTLFRAWNDEAPPKNTKNSSAKMEPFEYAGYRVVSMRDVLNREHIAQERWGYVIDEDGNVSYPDKARKAVSQKVASMTGTVREWHDSQTEEEVRQGRYVLQKVHSDKHGTLYRMEHLPLI